MPDVKFYVKNKIAMDANDYLIIIYRFMKRIKIKKARITTSLLNSMDLFKLSMRLKLLLMWCKFRIFILKPIIMNVAMTYAPNKMLRLMLRIILRMIFAVWAL